jgi:hypothetical protein
VHLFPSQFGWLKQQVNRVKEYLNTPSSGDLEMPEGLIALLTHPANSLVDEIK